MSIGILSIIIGILCAIIVILSRDATVPTRKIDTTQRQQIRTKFIEEI